eukprot:gene2119-4588_t
MPRDKLEEALGLKLTSTSVQRAANPMANLKSVNAACDKAATDAYACVDITEEDDNAALPSGQFPRAVLTSQVLEAEQKVVAELRKCGDGYFQQQC